jgi:hypothetical protein
MQSNSSALEAAAREIISGIVKGAELPRAEEQER